MMKSEKYRGRRIHFKDNYFRGRRIVNAYLNGASIGVGLDKQQAFNDAKNKIDMYYMNRRPQPNTIFIGDPQPVASPF